MGQWKVLYNQQKKICRGFESHRRHISSFFREKQKGNNVFASVHAGDVNGYDQGRVRYGTYRGVPAVYTAGITGTGHCGKFSTASIPVPETSVSSVRHQYRYRRLRQVRYDINTGTGHCGKFGTTSIPVPETSVSSVRHQCRYRTLR